MIIVKILTEEIAKEILDNYPVTSKDYLVCQSVEEMQNHILKLIKRSFFIINSQEYTYNPDFVVIPHSDVDFEQILQDIDSVDIIITNIKLNGVPCGIVKEEFETKREFLARLDDFRQDLKIQTLLEESKNVINVENKIQYIKI